MRINTGKFRDGFKGKRKGIYTENLLEVSVLPMVKLTRSGDSFRHSYNNFNFRKKL